MYNPNHTMETIYTLEGEPHECTRLNALDLVRTGKYQWTPHVTVIEGAPEALQKAAETPKTEPAKDTAPSKFNTKADDLDIIAEAMDKTDVAAYLEQYTLDQLKQIAQERYGLKIKGNISKATAIQQLVDAEVSKVYGEDAKDAAEE